METLTYEELEVNDGVLIPDSLAQLRDLVRIVTEGNIIYICHPRHLFDEIEEDPETKTIRSVNWDSYNVERMKNINSFGRYSIVEQLCNRKNNQLTYLKKVSEHFLKKYKSSNLPYVFPLAVIEEIFTMKQEWYLDML